MDTEVNIMRITYKTILAALGLAFVVSPIFAQAETGVEAQWFNGTYLNNKKWDYTTDYQVPNYGTHDWIADHAKNLLPRYERKWIDQNRRNFLLGTEAPDNASLQVFPGVYGYGDFYNHEIWFNASQQVTKDNAAVRAQEEFELSNSKLPWSERWAAYYAGTLAHYVGDISAYPHVMGSGSHRGEESHHSEYERGVNEWMKRYAGGLFEQYISADGLAVADPYDETIDVAAKVDFGDGALLDAGWMNTNLPLIGNSWRPQSEVTYRRSAGLAMNEAVNSLADLYHTLAVQNGYVVERYQEYRSSTKAAIKVSKKLFPSRYSANAVALVAHNRSPEAMAATPFIKQQNGSILISNKNHIDSRTMTELRRVLNSATRKVYIVGHKDSIGWSVGRQLRDAGFTVERISGKNNYVTAIEASKRVDTAIGCVVVPRWSAAMAPAASVAAGKEYPLLFSGKRLHGSVRNFLTNTDKGRSIQIIYLVGNNEDIPSQVRTDLAGMGKVVIDLTKKGNPAAVARMAQYFYTIPTEAIVYHPKDVNSILAAPLLSAANGAPMLISYYKSLPQASRDYLSQKKSFLNHGYVFGPMSHISYRAERIFGVKL
ncbi:cell wall-binding repeat-containing protein [Patescibacteria group bacterium]